MNAPRKRVLLVEDNPENQYLTTLLLEGEGYEVTVVGNGLDGVQAAADGDFDVILLDLQLPDIDGFEVARRVRDGNSRNGMPIIAVSAFAMASDRRRAYAAGCTGYLEKPIDADCFVAQVQCLAGMPAS
jgi:two-component system, cell cycle response regulator DivK